MLHRIYTLGHQIGECFICSTQKGFKLSELPRILCRKNIVPVHFITVPCEPNTVHKVQGKPYFCSSFHCAGDIALCILGFKVSEQFCMFL